MVVMPLIVQKFFYRYDHDAIDGLLTGLYNSIDGLTIGFWY